MAIDFSIKEEGQFKYIESKTDGPTLMLLHGLFGALSNFEGIINEFSSKYNVVVPLLPLFEMPVLKVSVSSLMDYAKDFVEYKGYGKVNVLGNSLGGHIALLYVLDNPEKVESLILTGSSGLFESAMGDTYPKRGNYEYIKKKTEDTFYDPEVATEELIAEVFDIVNDRSKVIRVLKIAKSAIRHNLGDKLHELKTPTLLVWGKQDKVTPAFVGEKFHELLPNSQLIFVDKCGHAPMMEKPEEFNTHLGAFLEQIYSTT